MFGILMMKELQLQLRTVRFSVALAITVVIFTASAFIGAATYSNQRELYEKQFTEQKNQLDEEMAGINRVALHRQKLLLPPAPYPFIADPALAGLPNAVDMNVTRHWDMERLGSVSPFISSNEGFTWLFIVSAVCGFVAILLSYDAVVGEKRSGTLAQVMSNSVKAWQFIIAKFSALTLLNAVLLVLGMILSFTILSILGVPVLNGDSISTALLFLVLSIVYLAFITSSGIFVSSVVRSSSLSLIILLFFWVFFAVVLPSGARVAAVSVQSAPTPLEKTREMRAALSPLFSHRFNDRPSVNGSKIVNYSRFPFTAIEEFYAECTIEINQTRQRIQESFDKRVFAQSEFGLTLAGLSPIELFRQSTLELSDAGLSRFKRFLDSVEDYRLALGNTVKNIDARDPNSPHVYFPERTTINWISSMPVENPNVIPRYRFPRADLMQRVVQALVSAGALVIWLLIFFLMAVFAFLRLDQRAQA